MQRCYYPVMNILGFSACIRNNTIKFNKDLAKKLNASLKIIKKVIFKIDRFVSIEELKTLTNKNSINENNLQFIIELMINETNLCVLKNIDFLFYFFKVLPVVRNLKNSKIIKLSCGVMSK